jgi:hypothetical protein
VIYLLALAIAIFIGIFTLRLIVKENIPKGLGILLGAALGLGIMGQMIFYIQLVGDNFNPFLPPFLSLLLVGILFWQNKKIKKTSKEPFFKENLLVLLVILIPLWLEGNFFHMGGWDAWSCWNLKAKFIFLGQQNWKDMFDPILWRSNTGYPLVLPTMNVWFWHWTGFSQNVLFYNAIVISILTAGLLLFGLQSLNVPKLPSIIVTLTVFLLAFGNTLCVSQYSDILFSLYLLCFFICYFLFYQTKEKPLLIVMAIFIGLLSFTKNEGLAASAILAALILLQRPLKPWLFIGAVILASLPTLIFILHMAPKSQAFINGFLSTSKPTSFERLKFILTYTLWELTSLKWMGIWILAGLGLALGWKKAFDKPLMSVGIFIACYLAVVIGYYQINTFFDDISWWMDFTLNRILFALLPSVFLWMGISVFSTKEIRKDA